MSQLNKLQIKAELLTVITKLQTNLEASDVDAILQTLDAQEDKKSILDLLIKELVKSNEQKAILICYLLLRLCVKEDLENNLWEILKSSSVNDVIKSIVLNLLKDMGNKIDYTKFNEYFENPEEVIDADTQRLLSSAIVNPEAQIDFLDFIKSLSEADRQLLVQSLGDDYSSDDLANILNPLFLYEPTSELGRIAISILGNTKSQLALHALLDALEFVTDEEVRAMIKKSISSLKIAGVREDNAVDFYKSVLSTKPYKSFTSYPDGHGNQALIFSRENEETEAIQFVAVVINDRWGIVDCFGFNEISVPEFERIVQKFYNGGEQIYINHSVLKTLLQNAEKLTRKTDGEISYEYICWKTLLADIQAEPVPVELILSARFSFKELSKEDLNKIYAFEFIQKWFLDTDYNSCFKSLVEALNEKMSANDFKIDFDLSVSENKDEIFTDDEKNLLDKRILMCAYLKYLSGNNDDAQLLYSLYFDDVKKAELIETIIKKSIYEYYVALKFKHKEENNMMNIFARRNQPKTLDLSSKQIDLAISLIESLWVNG